MIYEHRTYYIPPRKMDAIVSRFRDHTMTLFNKHGIKVVGFWTTELGDRSNGELVYICAFEDLNARDAAWNAFRADPVWAEVVRRTEADGPIVSQVNVKIMLPSDFSPLP